VLGKLNLRLGRGETKGEDGISVSFTSMKRGKKVLVILTGKGGDNGGGNSS